MSFFRYPGGKSKLVDDIKITFNEVCGPWHLSFEKPNKLPMQYDFQYREPFFGGGSIGIKLLTEGMIKKIWINDKDVGIACIWTSVIRQPEEFKKRILMFTPSVKAFISLKDELSVLEKTPSKESEIVDIAFKKLAIHQISYSGLGVKSGGPLGGVKQESKYKINCRWSPNYICKKIDKLNEKFKNVNVYSNGCTNLDFGELITDTSCKSVLYLDPPYYIKGNDLYQHGFKEEDHERLANLLKQTKHKWVLSYDECQKIKDLYTWNKNIKLIKANYSITNARIKSELLIWN